MSLGILGQKLGMTRVFNEAGQSVPVTVIAAGPCSVVDVRTPEKNGYSAVLLGLGERKPHKVTKPLRGMYDRCGVKPCRWLREFRIENSAEYKAGQIVDVAVFAEGETVSVTGTSKGKGFAGVMKRWNFGGLQASHGVSVSHRKPASSGASSYPSHIFKGKTMPGHLGNERVTIKNLTVVAVDKENSLLLIKGAVPGAKNGLVLIHKQG
ncbi:50S ribosomal protein L3 [Pyramidobacter sp. SM-530-WT-4B]|uniref:Large ribosomal subunit protein uL3 n=1 Tax=Pyramidobacter porci TaxID=2605789 RepID=A0A6L5Y944_9BACT|nr:50S ribosomal protein L3 [Pyramidobacter porci]MST54799.1 50S ribosomal protein L3 [Pyramidobacter porci]